MSQNHSFRGDSYVYVYIYIYIYIYIYDALFNLKKRTSVDAVKMYMKRCQNFAENMIVNLFCTVYSISYTS